ncbi:MAG: hypothetical protein J5992_03385 [Oscillospiraceae bacterium]|nr:hypothetical protein [Oscillospiraceae bacterium]
MFVISVGTAGRVLPMLFPWALFSDKVQRNSQSQNSLSEEMISGFLSLMVSSMK